MKSPYTPISCELHDRLEEAAVLRRQCEIVYRDDSGRPVTVHERIVTIVTTPAKEEYVRLEDGQEIRLDALVTVDGVPFPAAADSP